LAFDAAARGRRAAGEAWAWARGGDRSAAPDPVVAGARLALRRWGRVLGRLERTPPPVSGWSDWLTEGIIAHRPDGREDGIRNGLKRRALPCVLIEDGRSAGAGPSVDFRK
jgi:hypothetical protein